jgi:FkbM family methyltransferase
MPTTSCIFKNDDNVSVLLLPDHPSSCSLAGRDNHEVCFRQINTFLIKSKLIKNNIIDLGAWIGDNSIPWAKNISSTIYAIDPSPENCSFITETCKLNAITNVKVIQSAISDKNEILETNDEINHCSFVYGVWGGTGKNKVSAVSLDYLHELKCIENIGYIHLDVEGMEYNVLKGASAIMAAYRPIVSFEQHLNIDNYSIILNYFNERQYKVFLVDEIMPGCWPDCRNSFAFPCEIYTDELIKTINALIGRDIMIPR